MNIPVDRFGQAILYVIAFVLCTTVHEFGHAWVATRLGDPTPGSQGRLTLNPIRHIDPIGTLLLPLLLNLFAPGAPLLAWGRPVETQPRHYSRRFSMLTGRMFVAAAGPLMNLVMAMVMSILVVGGVRMGVLSADLADTLQNHLIVLNLWLLFFNLLPIPPLDGGDVLAWALPRSMHGLVDVLRRYGFLILMVMLMVPQVMNTILTPAAIMIGLWKMALAAGMSG